jgi:hypothetical protein
LYVSSRYDFREITGEMKQGSLGYIGGEREWQPIRFSYIRYPIDGNSRKEPKVALCDIWYWRGTLLLHRADPIIFPAQP